MEMNYFGIIKEIVCPIFHDDFYFREKIIMKQYNFNYVRVIIF